MTSTRVTLLQLCPFSSYLEGGLARRFEVIRWFERSEREQGVWLKERANDVRAVVTGGHIGCSNDLMRTLPRLAVIAINGVGVDKVDLQLAHSLGIHVGTTPGILTDDVADLAVGLTIDLLRGITASDAYVRAGDWVRGDRPLGRKVSGRRFGIVGLGQIGLAIATRLAAFGPVAYTGPKKKPVIHSYHESALALARECDVMVIACPANAATRHLIDASVLDALGPSGYLVNVARGSVVDETALIAALEAGRVAGAALDVFEREPHVPEALRNSPKVVLTPHVASATVETRMQMADRVLAELDAGLTAAAAS